MESVFYNGGFIGTTMDFGNTERYLLSGSIDPTTITLVANTGRVTLTGASLTLPAGLATGDLVIVASASDNDTPSYPTGYTQGQRGRSSVGYQWAYKFMGNPVDTTVSGLTNDSVTTHLAAAFRGVNSITPLDATSPTVTSAGSGTPNPPAITTVTNNAVVVALGFLDDDNVASTAGAPTNYTFAAASQGSGTGATVMAAFRTRASAGSEDPGAFSGGTDDNIGATLALRPGEVDNRVFGNQKNSGIWNIQAAYEEIYSKPPTNYSPRTSSLLIQSSTSYTFNNIDIGTATGDRLVVIGVTALGGSFSSGTISGLTINGVSATEAIQTPNNDNFTRTAIFYLSVTSGTTANIVATLSAGSAARCFITSYALYGLGSTTPLSTNTNAASTQSLTNTVDTAIGSIIISLGSVNALTTMNWTNVNQDFTAQDVRTMTGASLQTTTSGSRIVTLQQNSGTNQNMQLATAVWI